MYLYKSGAWYDRLLLDDCPGLDATVFMLGIADKNGMISFHPKADCVISGVEEAEELLKRCGLESSRSARNGDRVEAGKVILQAQGKAEGLHKGWKISQCVMEYMSGIATRTADMVQAAAAVNPQIHIALTRKHMPGAKTMSHEAGLSGGGTIHRLGLSDSVLVFAQHRLFLEDHGTEDTNLKAFARRVPEFRAALPEKKLCAEIATIEEAVMLAEAGIDIIQCEKFPCPELTACVSAVRAVKPDIILLAAGGINGANAAQYAATGVDVLVTSWPYFGKPVDIKVRMSRLV